MLDVISFALSKVDFRGGVEDVLEWNKTGGPHSWSRGEFMATSSSSIRGLEGRKVTLTGGKNGHMIKGLPYERLSYVSQSGFHIVPLRTFHPGLKKYLAGAQK